LALKGIEYEYKAVSLIKDGGQQFSDEYRKINDQCAVPSLVIDGHTLTQSMAIIEYLDETRPSPRILPKDDAHKRAVVRRISECIACDIQPIQNLGVLKYVGDAKKSEWGRHWIDRGFQGMPVE
jgi:maleylacetoacetate isomerase